VAAPSRFCYELWQSRFPIASNPHIIPPVVLKWKENILKFDATTYAQGIVNGEFWAVHGYPENVFQLISEEDRQNFEFFVPKEGGTLWIDNMVILKDAKGKDFSIQIHRFHP